MEVPVHEQLRRVWVRSKMSLPELCEKAHLDCSADSLSRKLRGKQVLSTDEAAAIAGVFEKRVLVGRRRRAA